MAEDGDLDLGPGSIRARLNIQVGGIAQSFVGNYAFRVVSPAGQFTPITNFFSITNSAFAQSFRGVITCSGTNVPNATVLSFPGLLAETSPLAGVVADNSGAYTLNTPPGTYSLLPFKPGFVTDATALPMVTLNPGATLTTNLAMLPATRTISGRFVDAANPTNGLPGILVVCESADFRLVVGFTSTNGTFTVPVTAGLWRVSMDEEALLTSASVDVDTHPEADTTAGSVTNVIVALPKATTLIYGSIKDDQNRPSKPCIEPVRQRNANPGGDISGVQG